MLVKRVRQYLIGLIHTVIIQIYMDMYTYEGTTPCLSLIGKFLFILIKKFFLLGITFLWDFYYLSKWWLRMFSGNSVCLNTAVYENVSSFTSKSFTHCRPCNSSICITFAIFEVYIMCLKSVLFHYSTIILLTSTYIHSFIYSWGKGFSDFISWTPNPCYRF